jgi:hypothetical protein
MKTFVTISALIALILLISLSAAAFQNSAGRMLRLPADLTPQTIPFSQNWSDTNLISTSDDWSGVPGIIGYRGDITATSTAGVDPQTLLTPLDSVVDVNANQSSPNTFTSGGVSEFSGIADPVVALQGSGTADAPSIVITLVTTGKFGIHVSYNLRDIDGSADNSIQQVALQYRVGTSGDYTNIPAGYVADASSGPSLATLVTPVSVTLPAGAEDQPVIQLRIITTNAVGSDEWIGVDDISVTANTAPAAVVSASGGPLAFGTVAVGDSSAAQSFTVSGTDLTADLVVTAPAGFEVSSTSGSGFGSSVTLTPSGGTVASTTIYARFMPVAPGHHAGLIACSSTGATTQDVAVSGTALPGGFALTPSSIDFGSLVVGSTFTDTVIATNGGATPITVTSVTSTSGDFTVAPASGTVNALSGEPFEVSFTPTSAGAKSGSIIFVHSGGSSPDTVAVSGTGVDVLFAVTPSSVNFGDLEVGSQKSDTVVVSNNGGGTLAVSAVTSTNAEFTVAPSTASLGAGASAPFVITFAPASTGSKAASIVFTHNGATSPDTVAATGKGIQVVTIAAARALPNASLVTIEGILTRSLGAFSRIQDSTAGLSIRQATGSYFNDLASGALRQGDRVRITGITSEFNGLKQFNAADLQSYTRISRDNPLPASQVVTLDEIRTNGEQYESELITVHTMTIVNGADASFLPAKTYQISDPSDATNAVALRTPNAGDSDIDGVAFSGTPVTFNGVLGQFSSADPAAGYQLLPVLVTDIDFTNAVVEERGIPTVFALRGNYPNPFNPTTTIAFDVPREAVVTIDVYNLLGARVAQVVAGAAYQAGSHEISFDASRLSSGVYYYRLTAGDFTAVNKMVLLK